MFSTKKKRKWLAESMDEVNAWFVRGDVVVKNLSGKQVVLARENDRIYAFKNKCPHQGKSFEGGWVKNGRLVCPVHQHSYDLTDGKGHGTCVEKYELEQDDQGVWISWEAWSLF